MKKIILKTTALLITLAGLFTSCNLFEDDDDDPPSGLIVAPAFNKAALSLSVAGEGEARTALPSVSVQEFDFFDFNANNGTASITKSWTGDSEKTAYAKMTSETFEIDVGIWKFILKAQKGGVTYSGSVEKEITAGANNIEFTLSVAELKDWGKGSMEIKLSVPTKVKAVTATLCYTDERIVSTSGIEQSISLTDSIVRYSAPNVYSFNYLVIFNLYADTSKKLLLGKWREYAVVTNEVTSKSEITIAADDLDELYPITYVLNGGTFKENWSGSYTRRMTFPTQKDLVNNEGLKFDGWYTDADCTQLFDATICSGNLTLYAKWRNWYANEVEPAIRSTELTGTFENPSKITIEGEITSAQLSGITSAMKNCRCYLSLDLAKTEGLKYIYEDDFKGCVYLTGIVIPDTVTEIYNGAFSRCSGLTEMTIPFVGNSVSATSDRARFIYIFGNSEYSGGIPSSLKTVTVMGGELKYGAFLGCNTLETITISEGVTSIGNSAFSGCSGLERVTIPSSVTSIGAGAFSGCSGLTEMTIPFVGESVSATGEASLFGYIFGKSSYTDGTATKMYYPSSKSETYYSETYYIPSSLKTVTVMGGELKYGAFYGCSGLESVTIPEGVTSIGNSAFSGCSGLESVTIPEGVTSIGKCAFDECRGLESVMIPGSVTSIGDSAFDDCRWLESVYFDGTLEQWLAISFASNPCCNGSDLYIQGNKITDLVIPNGVTSIGDYAFDGCIGLKNVTIPNGVTSIGDYAFDGCIGLKNMTIQKGVTSIGEWAFHGCSGLESVTIPSSVTSIGVAAFTKCSGLKSVTIIGNGGLKIWGFTFSDCSELTSVTIGTGVKIIGDSAFAGCNKLETVNVLGNNSWNEVVLQENPVVLSRGCKLDKYQLAYSSRGYSFEWRRD